MKIAFLLFAAVAFTSVSFAGDCVLKVTRTACPGKEADSYKKCKGEKSCTEEPSAASEADCAKAALEACSNARLDITDSKTITATFKGKDVMAGKQFCKENRPDFHGCKK